MRSASFAPASKRRRASSAIWKAHYSPGQGQHAILLSPRPYRSDSAVVSRALILNRRPVTAIYRRFDIALASGLTPLFFGLCTGCRLIAHVNQIALSLFPETIVLWRRKSIYPTRRLKDQSLFSTFYDLAREPACIYPCAKKLFSEETTKVKLRDAPGA